MAVKIIPGVYVEYSAEGVSAEVNNQGGVVGIVGDFVYGDVNVPIELRSLEDFQNKLGGLGTEDAKRLYALLLQKPKKVIAVRVVGTGATKAQAVLKDETDPAAPVDVIRLTAKYVGSYGNDITASVSSGVLTISYGDKQELYSITDIDSLVSNINSQSSLVVAEKLANGTLTDQTVALSGGSNGTLTDNDYIGGYDVNTDTRTGLAVLELVSDVEIVTIGGAPSASKNQALINHAVSLDRIAVIPVINESNLTTFLSEVPNYYEDNGHVVVAFPAVQMYIGSNLETINPAYVVAGLLGRLEPKEAAVNAPLYGVVGVTRGFTTSELEQLISNKVNPITLKGSSYVLRHSRTTGDDKWKDINVVRVMMLIGKNTELLLDNFIGEPITPDLWQSVINALTNYLYPLKVAGWITDFQIKCDAENNPPELRDQGIVNVKIGIKPIYSAYYFDVVIEKVLRFSEQTQTQA